MAKTKYPYVPRGTTFEEMWDYIHASAEKSEREFERSRLEHERFLQEYERARKAEEQVRKAEEQARRKEEEKARKERERRRQEYEQARREEEEKALKEQERRRQEYEQTRKKADEEYRQLRKETEQITRDLNRKMGDLHNRFGEIAEHLVAPGIAKRFRELGYRFDDIAPGGREILDESGAAKAEIDLLLENGEYIAAVEVKVKPALKDIEPHIKRLEILRESRSRKNDTRKIFGAIAGAVFASDVKKAVREAGLYPIEQSGDTMKISVPPDFAPRLW